jgi:hypothetical protein
MGAPTHSLGHKHQVLNCQRKTTQAQFHWTRSLAVNELWFSRKLAFFFLKNINIDATTGVQLPSVFFLVNSVRSY